MSSLRMYVGGYTPSSGGSAEGISVFERPTEAGTWALAQVVRVDDPSFVVLTEGQLHAVSESVAGRVASFTVSAGELIPASIAASGGATPCHIVHDPASGALVVANYTAGTVAVLPDDGLDPARVARVLPLPAGSGPVIDRQEAPHAHSSTRTPWGTVLVSDLGTDTVYELRIDPISLEPSYVAAHAMPAGSGPRHFAWLGDLLLVAGELDGRLHVLSYRDGAFTIDRSVSVVDPHHSLGTGETLLSHVEEHDGLVYVAVRGRDSIAVLAPLEGSRAAEGADPGVSRSGSQLGVVAEVACGGRWPRHFAFDGADLYVANQLSHTVTVLPLDGSGVPGGVSTVIETGSPACIVFA